MFSAIKIRKIIIILLVVVITVIFTFPLMVKMNTCLPGFASTDEPYAALWHFWWTKYSSIKHLDYSNLNMIAAPFGQQNLGLYCYWNSINKFLSITTSPAFTYNVQFLSSFILTGLITYSLAFRLTGSFFAAALAALIFTFCPYHFARGWQHLGLAHIQWMPLYILSMFALKENKVFRSAVFAGLAFA